MSSIDKRALRGAAEKAGSDKWQAKKISGDFYVIRNGSYEKQYGITSYQPIAEIEHKPVRDYVAAANPATVLALLDELEAKDSTISTQQQEIRTLLNALEQATEKRNSDIPGQKRLIGWRASDYTDETSDPELAKNWAAAIGVLPIFEGDVNTKLSAAGIGKGE
ncbi:TPA: ead/Ea22-like family protein [Escherichia coli]|nr:ead/Ea22-like family protein [Escherichia coli]